MRVGDKIAPLHHPIFKPANLPDFLAVARIKPPHGVALTIQQSVYGLDIGG